MPRPSVVIAAHNEAAVIGRSLDALLADAGPDGVEVVVVANGCDDGTAAAANRPGVRVLDLTEPGKANALNAGDAVATGFPRLYVDADVQLSPGAIPALVAALGTPGPDGTVPLAVVPRRRLELTGRPLLVRAFYAINSRLPAYDRALFGRGAIALSERARARFDRFPEMIADDLYLDSLFARAEKAEVDGVRSTVATPLRTRDLVRRLVRVRAGNAALRAAGTGTGGGAGPVRRSDRLSWLRDVVLPRPWLAPAAVCYVAVTSYAALRARRQGDALTWGRDESTRPTAPHDELSRS
jgi:glycosyltransferase involved in cell wall biosynthesis